MPDTTDTEFIEQLQYNPLATVSDYTASRQARFHMRPRTRELLSA